MGQTCGRSGKFASARLVCHKTRANVKNWTKKRYRAADEVERTALEAISTKLASLGPDASAEEIQHALYDIARPIPRYQDMTAKNATPERPGVSNEFFNMIYAVLLGEERGPRLGSFIVLYGIEETRALIGKALAGDFVLPNRR